MPCEYAENRMLLRDINRSYVNRSYVGQTLVVAIGGIIYLQFGSTAGLLVALIVFVVVVIRLIQQFLRV